jgi:rubrerythrin
MQKRIMVNVLALSMAVLLPGMLLAAATVETKPGASGSTIAAPTMVTTTSPAAVAAASSSSPGASAPAVIVGTTIENLQTAFNGESNAQAKYQHFATQAEKEGYLKVASLFKALAFSEGIHAAKHAKVLRTMKLEPKANIVKAKVGTTAENLKEAIQAELYETESMYPAYMHKAEAEKDIEAGKSFMGAKYIESIHVGLLKDAEANLQAWKVKGNFWTCKVCGNVESNTNFEYCRVCKAPKSEFQKF